MQINSLEARWLECSFAKKKKDLGDNKRDLNQQHALTRKKVKYILGCIGESGSRLREVSLPLYCSNHYYSDSVS